MQKVNAISKKDQLFLSIQRVISFTFCLVLYCVLWFAMVFIGKWTIENIKQIRLKFRNIVAQAKGPLIICPNHLTYIDSLLLLWAFASPWFYLSHFHCFAWNLPEKQNAQSKWLFRLIAYLGKCLLVERGGSRHSVHKTLAKMRYLLDRNESLMIFPEGGRSLTGKIDVENASYGVGELLQAAPHTTVVCAYLRGHSQKHKSFLPNKKDTFYLDIEWVSPTTQKQGRKGARDTSLQIMNSLFEMEHKYFEQEHKTWK